MKRVFCVATCVLALTCAARARAQAEPERESPPPRSHLIGHLALGAEAATLYGLGHYGPRGIFGIGVEQRRVFTLFELAYANDRTPEGLVFHDIQLGATRGAVLGPVRLGGGISAAWLGIPRQSAERGVLGHFGAGVTAVVGVDVVQFADRGALGLELRGDAAWLFPGLRPTGSLLLSARF